MKNTLQGKLLCLLWHFNTHEFIKSLIKVGIDEEQAEAISAGILRAHEVDDLATKGDLREAQAQMRADSRELRGQTNAKLEAVAKDVAEAKVQFSHAATKEDVKKVELAILATKEDVKKVELAIVATKEDVKKVELAILATKEDVKKVELAITRIDGQMALLKWMLGITLSGVGALILMAIGFILKSFFS